MNNQIKRYNNQRFYFNSLFGFWKLKFEICLVFVSCILVILGVSFAHDASAGTIIKAPSYLGLNSGLVGSWNFDGANISGTRAKDSSGNNNHGTITGAVRVQGKIGQALMFDGNDDTVITTYDPSLPFSICSWIMYDDNVSFYSTIASSEDESYGFYINRQTAGNNDYLAFWGNLSEARTPDNSVQPSVWYYVCGVVDAAGTASLYINGALSGAPTAIGTIWNGVVHIGGSGSNMDGFIDDARIYNRTLSPAEIRRLYLIGGGSKMNKTQEIDSTDRGLVGHWSFDGVDIGSGGTVAKDRSGNGNNGTITGATKVQGKTGQALSFDGVSKVEIPDPQSGVLDFNDTQSFTISIWSRLGTGGNVRSLGKSNDPGYSIIELSTGAQLRLRDGSDIVDVGTTVTNNMTDGAWHHSVFVVDRATNIGTEYFDGVLVETDSVTTIGSMVNSDALRIGAGFSGNDFIGQLDDVRIYNRVLSAAEIKRLYDKSSASKTNITQTNASLASGLVGHWSFDGTDISGTRAKDRSGNNNHGTITGATKAQGKLGQALQFDGVDDQISVGDSTSLSSLEGSSVATVAFWVKKTRAIPVEDVYVARWGTHRLFTVRGEVTFSLRPQWRYGGTGAAGTSLDHVCNPATCPVPVDTWTHITVTYNDPTSRIYVNGILRSSHSGSGGVLNTGIDNDLTIGREEDVSPNFATAVIDDVRVYNRALSAGEIQKLYNQGR